MSEENKATNIYILSIPRIPGEYKLGIHRGALTKLYQRYETSVHDVQVHYFFKNVDARVVEQDILKENHQHRIVKKRTQRKSEWLQIDLDTLLLDLIMECVGNSKGRNEDGLFIIDKFIRSQEGQTTILEATGHEIPVEENEETSDEESDSDTQSSEQLNTDDQEVMGDRKIISEALEEYVKYTKVFNVKSFHREFKQQYKYLEPISNDDIQTCMRKLGWHQKCTCKGTYVYTYIVKLD